MEDFLRITFSFVESPIILDFTLVTTDNNTLHDHNQESSSSFDVNSTPPRFHILTLPQTVEREVQQPISSAHHHQRDQKFHPVYKIEY